MTGNLKKYGHGAHLCFLDVHAQTDKYLCI